MPFAARFTFDAGSGICLWADDDATRTAFDIPIDHHDIGLPSELAAAADRVVAQWDTCIDWSDPGGPSPWTAADREAFRTASDALLARLRTALGDAWVVRDDR